MCPAPPSDGHPRLERELPAELRHPIRLELRTVEPLEDGTPHLEGQPVTCQGPRGHSEVEAQEQVEATPSTSVRIRGRDETGVQVVVATRHVAQIAVVETARDPEPRRQLATQPQACLLYTSDAADDDYTV